MGKTPSCERGESPKTGDAVSPILAPRGARRRRGRRERPNCGEPTTPTSPCAAPLTLLRQKLRKHGSVVGSVLLRTRRRPAPLAALDLRRAATRRQSGCVEAVDLARGKLALHHEPQASGLDDPRSFWIPAQPPSSQHPPRGRRSCSIAPARETNRRTPVQLLCVCWSPCVETADPDGLGNGGPMPAQ